MTDDRESTRFEVSEETARRGQSLLTRISTEVVHTFKQYYGKGPVSAKSYLVDDLLFVVMRGGLNAAEKFLLEQGEVDVVRAYRQTFENRMVEVLSGKIEELTGRKVLTSNSQILFDPDLSVEIFVFDDDARSPRAATAIGQLGDSSVGEVAGEAPEAPDAGTRERG